MSGNAPLLEHTYPVGPDGKPDQERPLRDDPSSMPLPSSCKISVFATAGLILLLGIAAEALAALLYCSSAHGLSHCTHNYRTLTLEYSSTWTSADAVFRTCLLYTSPSPRDRTRSRMPSSA
eukprot:TRINITY_DN26621_c0_g1_i1.p1 TRINITY_DN26621_c0_g1~~TRINITY_DN26621_c0_g1_i1.p1  ORF type:complete len:121 (-),score=37.85 TRINITY_DN26621_c0_g1_i1:79-441(-)